MIKVRCPAVTFTISTYQSMAKADQGTRHHSFNLQNLLLLAQPSKSGDNYYKCDKEDSIVGAILPREDHSGEAADINEDEDTEVAL